jgi:hypothetical protein
MPQVDVGRKHPSGAGARRRHRLQIRMGEIGFWRHWPAGAEPGVRQEGNWPLLTKMAGAVTPEGAEQLVAVVTEGECGMLMRLAGSWAAEGSSKGKACEVRDRDRVEDRFMGPLAPELGMAEAWISKSGLLG